MNWDFNLKFDSEWNAYTISAGEYWFKLGLDNLDERVKFEHFVKNAFQEIKKNCVGANDAIVRLIFEIQGLKKGRGQNNSFILRKLGENKKLNSELLSALNDNFYHTQYSSKEIQDILSYPEWDHLPSSEEIRKEATKIMEGKQKLLKNLAWLQVFEKYAIIEVWDTNKKMNSILFSFKFIGDGNDLWNDDIINKIWTRKDLKDFAEFLKEQGELIFKEKDKKVAVSTLMRQFVNEKLKDKLKTKEPTNKESSPEAIVKLITGREQESGKPLDKSFWSILECDKNLDQKWVGAFYGAFHRVDITEFISCLKSEEWNSCLAVQAIKKKIWGGICWEGLNNATICFDGNIVKIDNNHPSVIAKKESPISIARNSLNFAKSWATSPTSINNMKKGFISLVLSINGSIDSSLWRSGLEFWKEFNSVWGKNAWGEALSYQLGIILPRDLNEFLDNSAWDNIDEVKEIKAWVKEWIQNNKKEDFPFVWKDGKLDSFTWRGVYFVIDKAIINDDHSGNYWCNRYYRKNEQEWLKQDILKVLNEIDSKEGTKSIAAFIELGLRESEPIFRNVPKSTYILEWYLDFWDNCPGNRDWTKEFYYHFQQTNPQDFLTFLSSNYWKNFPEIKPIKEWVFNKIKNPQVPIAVEMREEKVLQDSLRSAAGRIFENKIGKILSLVGGTTKENEMLGEEIIKLKLENTQVK